MIKDFAKLATNKFGSNVAEKVVEQSDKQ